MWGLPPDEYAPFLAGTHILPLDEAVTIWQADESAGLKSLKGSNVYVDTFNVKYGVYSQAETGDSYFDPSFTLALQAAVACGARRHPGWQSDATSDGAVPWC